MITGSGYVLICLPIDVDVDVEDVLAQAMCLFVKTDRISVSFLAPNMGIFGGFGQFCFRPKMHFSDSFFRFWPKTCYFRP